MLLEGIAQDELGGRVSAISATCTYSADRTRQRLGEKPGDDTSSVPAPPPPQTTPNFELGAYVSSFFCPDEPSVMGIVF